ncbi:hypothetical protein BJ508DRAFT_313491 [Ascobolus immersus RN42]|uniref:Uncharacterized protein n=1 Tax=Ascobolus immersus RN42 TaxID=1160509 RepID=A0A3N4HVU8_ASCIM|nr:hypothetical protein BJ508DRAFT_313491 [Ascobolus immersus RN42]
MYSYLSPLVYVLKASCCHFVPAATAFLLLFVFGFSVSDPELHSNLKACTNTYSAFHKALVKNTVPSEFDDYFDWLDQERCFPLRRTNQFDASYRDMWGRAVDEELYQLYQTRLEDPECKTFYRFIELHCWNDRLYRDFLAFDCTVDNPDRWDAMPEAYRSWRQTSFAGKRQCFIPEKYRGLSDVELFSKFGYLKSGPTEKERKARAKCESIIWVDEEDPRWQERMRAKRCYFSTAVYSAYD